MKEERCCYLSSDGRRCPNTASKTFKMHLDRECYDEMTWIHSAFCTSHYELEYVLREKPKPYQENMTQ